MPAIINPLLPSSFNNWMSRENIPLCDLPSGCVTNISTSPHVGLPRR